MRTRRSLLAAVAVTASLAAPASALAQSAGDDQYTDPFAAPDAPAQEQPAAPPEPGAAPTPEGGNGSVEPAPSAGPAQVEEPALPRTGLPLAVLAAAGYALLLAGIAIRRQV